VSIDPYLIPGTETLRNVLGPRQGRALAAHGGCWRILERGTGGLTTLASLTERREPPNGQLCWASPPSSPSCGGRVAIIGFPVSMDGNGLAGSLGEV